MSESHIARWKARRSSEKRKFGDTGLAQEIHPRSHPKSSLPDEYGSFELDSQDLHGVMDVVESGSNTPAKAKHSARSTSRLSGLSTEFGESRKIESLFDAGSQRSSTDSSKRKSMEQHQKKVDTFFSSSKPSISSSRSSRTMNTTPTRPGEIEPTLLIEEDTAEVFRSQRLTTKSAGHGVAPQSSPLAPSMNAQLRLPTESKPHVPPVVKQMPLAPNVPRGDPNLLRRSFGRDNSFSEATSDPRDTSFSEVFSRPGSFSAPKAGTSAQTSFTEPSASSQGSQQPTDVAVSPSKPRVAERFQVRQLPNRGLFAPSLPQNILSASPWVKYECVRLVQHYHIPPEALSTLDANKLEDYDALWSDVRTLASRDGAAPPRSPTRAWEAAKLGSAEVCRSASLTFPSRSRQDLCELRMTPLQVERSCRFFRKFGSHRFLKLSLPSFKREHLPEYLADQSENLRHQIREWLKVPDKELIGWTWNVLYVKPYKGKKKGQTFLQDTSDVRGYDIYLFATGGIGLEKVSMEQLFDWYMPVKWNSSMMACKAFARLELGLSKTIATLQFKPSQIKETPDILADGSMEATAFNDESLAWPPTSEIKANAVMNDGCSRMSVGAAKQVWSILREAGPFPSLFQARLGPWKGVWTVCSHTDTSSEDIWIEVSPSQKKFRLHEQDMHDTTYQHPERLTFEVLQWSHMPVESCLHIDYLPLLEDRGVPREALEVLVKHMLDEHREELENALDSPPALYKWIEDNFGHDAEVTDFADVSESKTPADRIKSLIAGGFDFQSFQALQKMVKILAKSCFKRRSADLRIPVLKSTSVFGIADPKGVLAPGEIHLAFSGSIGRTSDTYLHGVEVLVGRHPACRPSDVQKVKAVLNLELGHLKDVVVFPSRGQIPLASKLQGGDYDGDKFWVCWEPALVTSFNNAPCPLSAPEPESLGITVERRTVAELFHAEAPRPLENFFNMALSFAMQPPLLGIATNFLTNICYHHSTVSSEAINRLADLHDYLVDTAKNGYCFSWVDWGSFCQQLPGLRAGDKKAPRYKSISQTTLFEKDFVSPRSKRHPHIVDHLIFDVARSRSLQIMSDIDQLNTQAVRTDPQVSKLCVTLSNTTEIAERATNQAMQMSLKELFNRYKRRRAHVIRNKPGGSNGGQLAALDETDRQFRLHYRDLEPPEQHLQYLDRLRWFRKDLKMPSYWECFKASCLFHTMSQLPGQFADDFIFTCDTDNVCFLKAWSVTGGRPATIVQAIAQYMSMRKVRANPDVEKSFTLSSFDGIRVEDDDGDETELDESSFEPSPPKKTSYEEKQPRSKTDFSPSMTSHVNTNIGRPMNASSASETEPHTKKGASWLNNPVSKASPQGDTSRPQG